MNKRERRLINVLGARRRLRRAKFLESDPMLINALVLHCGKVTRTLTLKDVADIHKASLVARDVAHDQVITWNSAEGARATESLARSL